MLYLRIRVKFLRVKQMTELGKEFAKGGAKKIAEGSFSDVPSIPREMLKAIENGYSSLSPLHKYLKENNVDDVRVSKALVDALDRGYTPITKVHNAVATNVKEKQVTMRKDFCLSR